MENSVFAFGSQYASIYAREPGIAVDEGFLDPSLLSPSGSWEPPQPVPVQRFLQDPQKTAFFNAGLDPTWTLPARPAAHGVPLSAPESHVTNRFESPMSLSENPSSVSAGDDVYVPDTPPDTALQYGSPTTHALRFMGPAPPANAYVPLTDVNPLLQQLDWNDMDAASLSLSAFTRSSYTSTTGPGSGPGPGPSDFELIPRDNNDVQQPMPMAATPDAALPLPSSTPAVFAATVDANRENETKRPAGKRRSMQTVHAVVSTSTSTSTSTSSPTPTSTLTTTPPKKRVKTGSTCDQCNAAPFKDAVELERHVKKQHTRPFHCVFNFAGCEDTFASKNEWKRHTTTQHLVPDYWLCTEGNCAIQVNGGVGTVGLGWDATGTKPMKCSRGHVADEIHRDEGDLGPSKLPNGKMFNRKDLYTAHLRRMHMPAHANKTVKPTKKTAGGKRPSTSSPCPGWDERVNMLQDRAKTKRCALPTHMKCPAATCGFVFDGPDAWDQRMEHVAQHLEADVAVHCGGPADTSLIAWAAAPGVAIIRKTKGGRWVLNDPLMRGVGLQVDGDGGGDDDDDDHDDGHDIDDMDAPGEEVVSFDHARCPL